MNKPKEILDLEKELGFELYETKDEGDLFDEKKHKVYILNNKNEIIGLNLSDCELSNICYLDKLVNLININLSENNISDISPLKQLVNLNNVDLSYNQVSDITPLKKLVNLTNLYLWNNSVSNISPLKELVNLTRLLLINNQISDISPLRKLVNLTRLLLINNQVSDISPLRKLVNLTELNLSHNQISNISPLKELVNLTRLLLINNQISDISLLKELVNLIRLDLSYNQVSDISPLKELVNLIRLDLISNQVSDISHLKELVNLIYLLLSKNQVSDISSLKQLVNLTFLDLRSNQVLDISHLKELINLTELNLSNNQVSDISHLKELINLTELGLISNQVSDISHLKELVNLTELNLSNNQVSDISPLKQLVNLNKLYLSDNQVSDISPLKQLVNLTKLDLSRNQVSNIAPLKQLVNLTELNLGYNKTSDISPLKQLVNLTKLDLRRNQVSDISLEFINSYPQLDKLFLYNNPIQNILKDVFDKVRGNVLKPVKDYLEGIEKTKKVNNEVKVILIGNGSVGKTQVATRLEQGEEFEFNKNHDSTHAISLLKKNIECEFLKEGLNLTIWDFGGQDIYHATHRLFMKTRAVFLLVWDIENEVNGFHKLKNSEGKKIPFKNEKLNYWLSYTSYFAKKSPIIVVQNKIDEFEKRGEIAPPYDEIAQNELKKQFPITEFIQVSTKNGKGFEVLENSIAEVFEDNEELKRELLLPLPAPWVAVRDRVRQEQQNQNGKKRISFQNFVEWCKKEDAENEADTLANFFHDTGVFYYQEEYFLGEIIINQSWAIEAVYKVLDKANSYYGLLKQKKGILDYKIIKKVWSENSDEERELFIDYMLSTELCFENTDDKKWDTTLSERSFLIPQLLLPKSKEEVLEYVKSFELKPSEPKEYSFLPTSIIQRFMIKAKDFSSVELMWQTGLFVEYKESKVIVEAVYEKNNHHILIYHNSAAKNDLLEVILEELDKLDDENSSRNLDRNKLHLGEKSLQRGFEKLQKHKKESQPLIHPIMSEKITQLKKQAEAGKFKEVFDYLDLYFDENPYNQYSTIKMNIEHQINMGFAPNPMQVQGLQLFLNGSKIKEVVPIIEQNHKTTTQKTTETMAYGTEKEIEGLRKPLEILIEKKNGFEDAISKTVDFEIKNSYKLRLKDTEQEIEELRQKIQKLKGENPNNSELKDLENKTQKAQIEMTEFSKNNKLNSNLNYLYDNDLEFLRNCYQLLKSNDINEVIVFLKETGFKNDSFDGYVKQNNLHTVTWSTFITTHMRSVFENNIIFNKANEIASTCRGGNLSIKNYFKEFTKDEKSSYVLNVFYTLEIMLNYHFSTSKIGSDKIKIQEILRQIENYREENTNITMGEESNNDNKTSVFISYNHKDKIVANKIKDFLRTKGIDVTIDSEAMKAGEDIKTFIEKCVRENDITLSLVSKNSLLSAWVAMESVLTFAGEKLANKKFIAVYEDDSFMKRSFTDDALDKVEEEILDISTTIQKRLSKNRRIEDLQNDLSRYRELESNLPQIIGRLKGSLCIPIGEDKFEEGMQKISNEI